MEGTQINALPISLRSRKTVFALMAKHIPRQGVLLVGLNIAILVIKMLINAIGVRIFVPTAFLIGPEAFNAGDVLPSLVSLSMKALALKIVLKGCMQILDTVKTAELDVQSAQRLTNVLNAPAAI